MNCYYQLKTELLSAFHYWGEQIENWLQGAVLQVTGDSQQIKQPKMKDWQRTLSSLTFTDSQGTRPLTNIQFTYIIPQLQSVTIVYVLCVFGAAWDSLT